MKKHVGLKDVANEAGVSTATVSYVINKVAHQTLTPETIARVNAAIQKLDYVPNMAARSLASQQSKLIGVVIPQTEPGKEFMFSNPFYWEFLSFVEYTARKNGYHVIFSGTNADEPYLQFAKTRSLDGIIIVGMYLEEHYKALQNVQIPVVLVDCYCKDSNFHSIQIDDRKGGYLATKYLIEKGHRKIALVTGMIKEMGVMERRFQGYKDAIKEAGIAFDKSLIFDETVSFKHGEYSGERIAKNPKGVTAVFACADILAVGVVKGLNSKGISVPRNMSIMSFDDTWLAGGCSPPLTSMHQDIAQKGTIAAQTLIDLSLGRIKDRQDITLPLSITERSSVKSVKNLRRSS